MRVTLRPSLHVLPQKAPEPPEIAEKLSRLRENLSAFLSSESKRPRIDGERRAAGWEEGLHKSPSPRVLHHPKCSVPPLHAHLLSSPHPQSLRWPQKNATVTRETHAARKRAARGRCSSPGKSCSRLTSGAAADPSRPGTRCPSRCALRALSGTGSVPGSPRPAYLAGAAGFRRPTLRPASAPSPAGLSAPPPRCSLGLPGRTRRGEGGSRRGSARRAEAEGRAQREEAAEPRSLGRRLRLGLPASLPPRWEGSARPGLRRGGSCRAQEGVGDAGSPTRGPRARRGSSTHGLWRSWVPFVEPTRLSGKNVGPQPSRVGPR